jgi:hypothetical protein
VNARSRETLFAAAAAIASVLVLFASLSSGIPKAYDLPDHLGSTAQVLRGFQEGALYPRWLAEFHDGWGEPTLLFYPPGLYFVAAGLAAIFGGDALTGLFAALALFAAIGAIGIFRFTRRRAGPWAGALASLLFAGVPYRFFEIYAAGLYSAFAAGCLIPWALDALVPEGRRGGGSRAWPLLFALIVLTNLPTGVLVAYLVGLWLIVRIALERRLGDAAPVAGGLVWGGLLAGVYLLPAVAEMRFVHVTFSEGTPLYRSNFLFQPSGSWMSEALKSMFDRMGLFTAAGLLLALAVLAAAARAGAGAPSREEKSWRILVSSVGLFSLFLLSPLSAPAWRFLPFLRRVNIPWRFLEPLGAAASCAVAAAAATLRSNRRLSRGLAAAAGVFFLALAGVCAVFDASVSRVNGRMSAAEARSAVERFSRKEMFFLPKGARRSSEIPPLPRLACDRPCRTQVVSWGAERRVFRVSAPSGAALRVRTYAFPGWRAEAEGRALRLETESATGAIVIDVPPGEHRVELDFGTTPLRAAGAVASGLAFLAWLLAGRYRRASTAAAAPATLSTGAEREPGA